MFRKAPANPPRLAYDSGQEATEKAQGAVGLVPKQPP